MPGRIALAGVLALTLAGCTQGESTDTGEFSGDEADVAQVVADLSDNATRNEASAVCNDILSERLLDAVTEEDSACINEVEKAFDDADGFVLDIEDITIDEDGETATAEVSSEQVGDDVTRTFSLVKQDDEWRIDSFG